MKYSLTRGVFIKQCSTQFIKQVLPRLASPSNPGIAPCVLDDVILFSNMPRSPGLLTPVPSSGVRHGKLPELKSSLNCFSRRRRSLRSRSRCSCSVS